MILLVVAIIYSLFIRFNLNNIVSNNSHLVNNLNLLTNNNWLAFKNNENYPYYGSIIYYLLLSKVLSINLTLVFTYSLVLISISWGWSRLIYLLQSNYILSNIVFVSLLFSLSQLFMLDSNSYSIVYGTNIVQFGLVNLSLISLIKAAIKYKYLQSPTLNLWFFVVYTSLGFVTGNIVIGLIPIVVYILLNVFYCNLIKTFSVYRFPLLFIPSIILFIIFESADNNFILNYTKQTILLLKQYQSLKLFQPVNVYLNQQHLIVNLLTISIVFIPSLVLGIFAFTKPCKFIWYKITKFNPSNNKFYIIKQQILNSNKSIKTKLLVPSIWVLLMSLSLLVFKFNGMLIVFGIFSSYLIITASKSYQMSQTHYLNKILANSEIEKLRTKSVKTNSITFTKIRNTIIYLVFASILIFSYLENNLTF